MAKRAKFYAAYDCNVERTILRILFRSTLWDGKVCSDVHLWFAGTQTNFVGSSCNDVVTSDGAGTTIISGHFDKSIRFWDMRAEGSVNKIEVNGKVTSLDLSRGNQFYSNPIHYKYVFNYYVTV